jgi:hypothetical protein
VADPCDLRAEIDRFRTIGHLDPEASALAS